METPGDAAEPATAVRPATEADVEDIARIWHSGWPDGHLGSVPSELLQHRGPEQFVARARDRWRTTWVSGPGDAVTGFVVVIGDEVEQIYVDAAARGTGVAGALMRRALDEIRRAGHGRAWLAVVAGNGSARSFYERQGWQDRGRFSYAAETRDGPVEVPCHR